MNRNKLKELFVDKLVIAAIVGAVSFGANLYAERYKLEATQKTSQSTEFVKACSEIWSKIYEYERNIEKLIHMKTGIGDSKKSEKEVMGYETTLRDEEESILKTIAERRSLIGENMTNHFWKYIGLVDAWARAEEESRDRQNDDDAEKRTEAEALYRLIAAMRFDVNMARAYSMQEKH